MKEKIYTIPVTEAFQVECECPMCILEKKLEDEYVDYILGPSLMEPDGRMETNEKGFCRRHFEFLYNKQVNRLGLGLIIDTHLSEQNAKLKGIFEGKADAFKRLFNSKKGFCLKHLRQLLEGVKKYLSPREASVFVQDLLGQQLEHLERIQKEVNWFTKKFDYRYNDAPWGNSRDALLRSIQKIVGFCDLK